MMKAHLVAWTSFDAALAQRITGWETNVAGGEALIEFGGRLCYQSWDKPNPATATNEGYLRHILEVQHFSILEHAQASFYLTGVSRSLTHELIRHRGFSVGEFSQRYGDVETAEMVVPPDLDDGYMDNADNYVSAVFYMRKAYKDIVDHLTAKGRSRKQARQAARSIMPNATETRILVTGNMRTWRHFIALRATEHADVEIFDLAVEIFEQLEQEFPNVFQDATRYDTEYGLGVRFPLTVV